MCLIGFCILLANILEYILKNPSNRERPLYESGSVHGFPGLSINTTSLWNRNGSMFGRVSEKNILFPRSTNMFMIKGRISFMRLLVIPRGPGAEIGLRSLTIFVISTARTGEMRACLSS